MPDEIDPQKVRPTYRREGEIVITGAALGTARITATTPDGSHTATCEVRVVAVDSLLTGVPRPGLGDPL